MWVHFGKYKPAVYIYYLANPFFKDEKQIFILIFCCLSYLTVELKIRCYAIATMYVIISSKNQLRQTS